MENLYNSEVFLSKITLNEYTDISLNYINDFFNKKDNKIILPTNETINKIISIINEHTEKQYSYENIEKLKKINEKLSLDINKYIEENNKLEEKLKIIKKNV